MAGVTVEGGSDGRKAVDANVSMVPMIDLLVSVIAFLLMSAVWTQVGAVRSTQPRSEPADAVAPPPAVNRLKIAVGPDGYRVGVTALDERAIPGAPDRLARLRAELAARHQGAPGEREVWIQPDGVTSYTDLVQVMDVVYDVWGGAAPAGAYGDAVTIRLM